MKKKYWSSKVKMIVIAWLLTAFCSSSAQADLVQFGLTSNSGGIITGSNYELLISGIVVDSVTFDATLSVLGDGASIGNDSSGLGVNGPTFETGESLSFALTVSGVTGGNVTFDGFTSLGFSDFNSSDFDAVLFSTGELIQGQTINSFDLTTLAGGAPASFSITGAGDISSFQLTDVIASFTGIPDGGDPAVPEPGLIPFLATIGSVVLMRHRKRNTTKTH